ncbi:transposase IS4 family protein [Desulfatibacillum aliphaticivorans]|uniref:Transposase IS4 family protein n=1 Tax=Desulfatibacillum aliphaticivorans TaxID=218208 RepID=B8FLD8_DESAL|nr:hypothetical protein [Desulfatibacillum aliphaticivorans]ACL05084.1 transposase IS4 family protein [Desulfatibacillum aliphaticivorans]
MREICQKQMPLTPACHNDFEQARELAVISHILDLHPAIYEEAYQDLCECEANTPGTGAQGMSAEQVVRAAIVKVLFGCQYRPLTIPVEGKFGEGKRR